MVFTRILTLRALPAGHYYFYLALYNVIYVMPLLAIVVAFAWTLGSRKLSEREGHLLKQLSGLMMAGLGVVLLIAPTWLASPWLAFGLLALALALRPGAVPHVHPIRAATVGRRKAACRPASPDIS